METFKFDFKIKEIVDSIFFSHLYERNMPYK